MFLLAYLYASVGRMAEVEQLCRIMEGRRNGLVAIERTEADAVCAMIRGDKSAELKAYLRMTEISPNAINVVGSLYLALNRPRAASEALAKYDPTLSRLSWEWKDETWSYRAIALHLLEEYSVELEIVREARADFPEHLDLLRSEIRALIALGRLEEAHALLERQVSLLAPRQSPGALLIYAAEEFDAHEYVAAAQELRARLLDWHTSRPAQEQEAAQRRRERAMMLIHLGRLAEAQTLFEELAEEFPHNLGDLGRLGVIYARLEHRDLAEAVWLELEDTPAPYPRGQNTRWRAYISANLGDSDGAVALLGQAMEEGWGVRKSFHDSPYLKPLWGDPVFEEFRKPKG